MKIERQYRLIFEPEDLDTLLDICRLARWHINDIRSKHLAEPVFSKNPPGFDDEKVRRTRFLGSQKEG